MSFKIKKQRDTQRKRGRVRCRKEHAKQRLQCYNRYVLKRAAAAAVVDRNRLTSVGTYIPPSFSPSPSTSSPPSAEQESVRRALEGRPIRTVGNGGEVLSLQVLIDTAAGLRRSKVEEIILLCTTPTAVPLVETRVFAKKAGVAPW